jgi:hypothetical protein
MIRDLSQTLRAILTQSNLPFELARAQIVFDRPTEQFKPSQTSVDVFLYDIRENVELRSNESFVERQNGQAIIHPPPMRVACSYLITAWPVGVSGDELFLQEHRLLSQALQVLSRYPSIPQEFLQGSLRRQEPPLPMLTSHIDNLKTTGEFWTALGNQLRPSISVTVTISMDVFTPDKPVPLVVAVDVQLESQDLPVNPAEFFKGSPDSRAEFFRIGGRLTGTDNKPITGATVTFVESGLTATTDAEGRYELSLIPYRPGSSPSDHTLRVQAGSVVREFTIRLPPPDRSSYNLQLT